MFGIGMNELLLLVVLALVFIGPQRLPEVARGLGRMMAQFKRASNDLRSAVSEEFYQNPEYRELQKLHGDLYADVSDFRNQARRYIEKEMQDENEIAGSVQREFRDVGASVADTMRRPIAEAEQAGSEATGTPEADEAAGTGEGAAGEPAPADPAPAEDGIELSATNPAPREPVGDTTFKRGSWQEQQRAFFHSGAHRDTGDAPPADEEDAAPPAPGTDRKASGDET